MNFQVIYKHRHHKKFVVSTLFVLDCSSLFFGPSYLLFITNNEHIRFARKNIVSFNTIEISNPLLDLIYGKVKPKD